MAEELRQAKAALGEVGEMVKSGKLKLQEAQQAQVLDEDDSALVDKKELKKYVQGLNQQVAQAFQQVNAHHSLRHRDAQIELMRGKLKDFDELEPQIRGLLDKVDPSVAANPDTIKQVHKIVRAELLEKREAERSAAVDTAGEDEGDWGEAEEEVAEVAPAGRAQSAKPAARPQGGVAPAGNASASRPVLRERQAAVAPLSRDEKAIAMQFGFKSAAEYRQYQNKDWHPDTQGSRGRNRF